MKLYITPFCPETFAEVCSKESERNCVDGWSSSHTSVLPVLSDNEFVVKVDGLFIPRVSLVTVCSRDEEEEEEGGGHIQNGTNMGPGGPSPS